MTRRREPPASKGGAVTDTTTAAEPDPRLVHLARGTMVSYWSGEVPDRIAIVSEHGNRTFGELNARANQLVRALRRRGVEPGAALTLMCRNRPEFAEVWAACSRGGYRLTPINWHLTGEEAGYIIDDCEAQVIVADARHAQSAAGAARQRPAPPSGSRSAATSRGTSRTRTPLSTEDDANIDDPAPGGQMLYTSGTTGRPKGVTRDMAAVAARRRPVPRPPRPPRALGSPRSTATCPATTCTSAPARCTTRRRWPSRSRSRSPAAWASC